MGTVVFFLAFSTALGPIILQSSTPNQHRGFVTAIYLFTANVIGLAAGPTVIAALSDYGLGGGKAIGFSLALVAAVVSPIGVFLLLWLERSLKRPPKQVASTL